MMTMMMMTMTALTEKCLICDNDNFWVPCFASGCTEPHTTIKLHPQCHLPPCLSPFPIT